MSTYTQILYHVVFATQNRKSVLDRERYSDLCSHIGEIIRKHGGHPYRIGGTDDHLHILCSLHPSVALADLVKAIKISSSHWIKTGKVFPGFEHWQSGYGAFTCSVTSKEKIVEYIAHQEKHHQWESSAMELKRLLTEAGIEYNQKYFE